MKKLFGALIFAFLLLPLTVQAKEIAVDWVAASVNGTPILHSEVLKSEFFTGKDYNGTLKELIDKQLLLQLAKKLGVNATEQEVSNALNRFLSSNNIKSLSQLEMLLSQRGLSVSDLIEQLRQQIVIAKLLKHVIHAKVSPTQLWQICSKGTRLVKIDSQKYSVFYGQLEPSLNKLIFNLKPGECSEFEGHKICLLKVEKKCNRAEVESFLRKREITKKLSELLKKLKRETPITVNGAPIGSGQAQNSG